MGNPFDDARRLLNKEKIKVDAPYMTNRVLSFLPISFPIAMEHNKIMGRIPQKWSDKIFHCVPRMNRIPYLKYAKKKKEKEPKLVIKICEYFGVNKYHADQIIDLLRMQGEEPEKYFGLKKGE